MSLCINILLIKVVVLNNYTINIQTEIAHICTEIHGNIFLYYGGNWKVKCVMAFRDDLCGWWIAFNNIYIAINNHPFLEEKSQNKECKARETKNSIHIGIVLCFIFQENIQISKRRVVTNALIKIMYVFVMFIITQLWKLFPMHLPALSMLSLIKLAIYNKCSFG